MRTHVKHSYLYRMWLNMPATHLNQMKVPPFSLLFFGQAWLTERLFCVYAEECHCGIRFVVASIRVRAQCERPFSMSDGAAAAAAAVANTHARTPFGFLSFVSIKSRQACDTLRGIGGALNSSQCVYQCFTRADVLSAAVILCVCVRLLILFHFLLHSILYTHLHNE